MTTKELAQHIEGILFWKGEPMKKDFFANFFEVSAHDVEQALAEVKAGFENRGISLIENDNEIELRTSTSISDVIEKMRKEELSRDLGKASLETLAIIAYKGPSTRKEIEYVRGVNCQSILRTLETRGLIEREEGGGRTKYKATTDFMAHLGISSWNELPEYQKSIQAVEKYEAAQAEESNNESSLTENNTEEAVKE